VGGTVRYGEGLFMIRRYSSWLLALGLIATFALAGCSSNKGTNYTTGNGMDNMGGGGNGSPGTEFDSGDLNATGGGYYGGGAGGTFQHVFNTVEVSRYYCKHHGGRGGTGMSGVITVQAGGTPSTYQVSITNNAFTPAALTIPVGSTVKWTNNSSSVHTVTSDN
jgi:plastocyanin